MIDKNTPMVSVLCITYNHEKFIKETIEGFLAQKVNFDLEICIHDDASTDKTADIISYYKNKYPHLIKCLLQNENQYSKRDGSLEKAIFDLPSGKYVAFCEGDDYWSDSNKLQIQFDFLEHNDDFGLVHHEADYLFEATGEIVKSHHKINNVKVSDGDVFNELLNNNNVYTPTVMFKKSLLKYLNVIDVKERSAFLMGDYVMWLEFSKHCKFHYIDKSMAVYRVLENSASKSQSYDKMKNFVNSYFDIKQFFLKRYPLDNVCADDVEQWRLSMNISMAIKFKQNKNALLFASKLKVYDLRTFIKRVLVFFPIIFRYIQRKNKL